MEVGAVDAPCAAALEAGDAVVPEPRDDAAERLGAVVEDRAAGVVLEARERLAGPGAVEQHVADHPALAGDRRERQQADPGQLGAREVAVVAAEQLVAAAHREECGSALDSRVQRRALGREVGRDELLLAILAAADVEELDPVRDGIAEPDRRHLELVAAGGGAHRQHGDVPAVCVDVEVLGVQVTDADLHACFSQKSETSPRPATMPRSPSIAV